MDKGGMMAGEKKSLADVMKGPEAKTDSEESSEPGYDAYTKELQTVLGVDESKAQMLRDIICGLARSEMMEDESGETESETPTEGPKKKKSLAILLGG